jgi:predicted transcriptional regulator
MAFPVKQVRTLEEQLHIIEEVDKTPSEKRIDVAKRLGLPPSTLNSIIEKKGEIESRLIRVVHQLRRGRWN